MRSVVVLPAPLAPNNAVICPSRALKETPSTACVAPKDLRSPSTRIMCASSHANSRRGTIVVNEGWHRAELGEAVRIQLRGRERLHEPRHAARANDAVALTGGDELARMRQGRDDLGAVARRRHRIELAIQHQHRQPRVKWRVKVSRST